MLKEEKETTIVFNEKDKIAQITTYNRGLIRKIEREAQNDTAVTVGWPSVGCLECTMPSEYITIKHKRQLLPENREALKDHAAQYLNSQ